MSDGGKQFECSICASAGQRLPFPSRNPHFFHMLNCHEAKIPCSFCHEHFVDNDELLESLERHVNERHSQISSWTCVICGLEFQLKVALINHLSLSHSSAHICDLCGCILPFASLQVMHKSSAHANHDSATLETLRRINHCQEARGRTEGNRIDTVCVSPPVASFFSSNANSDNVEVNADPQLPLLCLHCNLRYGQESLLPHMRKVWNDVDEIGKEEVIFCGECNCSLVKTGELRCHLRCLQLEATRFRDIDQKFRCGSCGYVSSDIEKWQSHRENFHREFHCDICQRRFIGELMLRHHEKTCDIGVETNRKRVQFNDNRNSSLSPPHFADREDIFVKQELIEESLIDEDSPTSSPPSNLTQMGPNCVYTSPRGERSGYFLKMRSRQGEGVEFNHSQFGRMVSKPYHRNHVAFLPPRVPLPSVRLITVGEGPSIHINSFQVAMEGEFQTTSVRLYQPSLPRSYLTQTERSVGKWTNETCPNCDLLANEVARLQAQLKRIEQICIRSKEWYCRSGRLDELTWQLSVMSIGFLPEATVSLCLLC